MSWKAVKSDRYDFMSLVSVYIQYVYNMDIYIVYIVYLIYIVYVYLIYSISYIYSISLSAFLNQADSKVSCGYIWFLYI